YGDVVSHLGEFAMKLFDKRNGVTDSIKKVRVAERNMLRAGCDLTADIFKHNFSRHDPENAVVYRHDGTMAAQMLAPAAGFRRAYNAITVTGNNKMRVLLQCR